jgi:hypothetical protein
MRFSILIGTLAGLATAFPAVAFDTPRELVDAIYQPYLAGQQHSDLGAFYSSELKQLFAVNAANVAADVDTTASIGVDDPAVSFNPFIDATNAHILDVAIGEPLIIGDQALVIVSFHNFDQPTLLSLSLVREVDGWKVDDVTSMGGEENWMLSWLLKYDPWSM